MIRTMVLDTNVLLTEPSSLFAFEENEVILPFTIIEEIDKIKSRPNEVGANAREVARELGELIKNYPGQIKSGIPLKNGGTLRIIARTDFKLTNKDCLSNEWDVDNKDNHILEVCLGLSKLHKKLNKPEPILITRDTILRVKSDFLGLKCEDYKHSSVIESTDKIYSGVATVRVPGDVIQLYWECSKTNKEFWFEDIEKHISSKLFPNQFIVLENIDNVFGTPDKCYLRFISEDGPLRIVKERTGDIFGLYPKNKEQLFALDLLLDPKIKLVTLSGQSGVGKTLLCAAAGLELTLTRKQHKNIMVCKPIVPVGQDIGFIPGLKGEKLSPWIASITDNLRFLLSTKENKEGNSKRNKTISEMYFQELFDNGTIEAEAITYLRGRSISDTFILVDEIQNVSAHELKTILTRVGENSKIVLTGDPEQIDAFYLNKTSNGLCIAIEKFKESNIVGHVSLHEGHRSEISALAAKLL